MSKRKNDLPNINNEERKKSKIGKAIRVFNSCFSINASTEILVIVFMIIKMRLKITCIKLLIIDLRKSVFADCEKSNFEQHVPLGRTKPILENKYDQWRLKISKIHLEPLKRMKPMFEF